MQAAEQQLVGSEALTHKSAALRRTWRGCQQHRAGGPESLHRQKDKDELGREKEDFQELERERGFAGSIAGPSRAISGWEEDGQHCVVRAPGSSLQIVPLVAFTPFANGQDLYLPVKWMKDVSWSDDNLDEV